MLPNYENAIKEINLLINDSIANTIKTHTLALEGLQFKDIGKLKEVKSILDILEKNANLIDNKVVIVLARWQPQSSELRKLVSLIKITNELVRIATTAKNCANMRIVVIRKGIEFDKVQDDILKMHHFAIEAIKLATEEVHGDYNSTIHKLNENSLKAKEIGDSLLLKHEALIDKDVILKALKCIRRLERTIEHSLNIAKLNFFANEGGELEVG